MVRFINGSLYTNHPPALMMTKTPLSRCRLPLGRLRFVPEVYGLQLFFCSFSSRQSGFSEARSHVTWDSLRHTKKGPKEPWTADRGPGIWRPYHTPGSRDIYCPRDTYKKKPPSRLSSLVGGWFTARARGSTCGARDRGKERHQEERRESCGRCMDFESSSKAVDLSNLKVYTRPDQLAHTT